MAINNVGYVRRSVARVASEGAYSFKTDGKTEPMPDVHRTEVAEYAATMKIIKNLCHFGRFRGSSRLTTSVLKVQRYGESTLLHQNK